MKITDTFTIPRGTVLMAELAPNERVYIGQVVTHEGKKFMVLEQQGFRCNCFGIEQHWNPSVGLLVHELSQRQLEDYQDYRCMFIQTRMASAKRLLKEGIRMEPMSNNWTEQCKEWIRNDPS